MPSLGDNYFAALAEETGNIMEQDLPKPGCNKDAVASQICSAKSQKAPYASSYMCAKY